MQDSMEAHHETPPDPETVLTLAGLQSVEAREQEIRRMIASISERLSDLDRRSHRLDLLERRSESLGELTQDVKGVQAELRMIRQSIRELRAVTQALQVAHREPVEKPVDIRPIVNPIAQLAISGARAALAACQQTLKKDPDLLQAIREEIEPLIDAVEEIAQ